MTVALISYITAQEPGELDEFPEAVLTYAKKVLKSNHSLINTYHIDIRSSLRQAVSAYEQLPTLRLTIAIYTLIQIIEEFELAADEPIKRLDGETEEDYKIRTVLSHLFH